MEKGTYADNTLWADQLDKLVGGRTLSIALSIGLEVSKVSNVAGLISWGTVSLSVWVDYSMIHQPLPIYVLYPSSPRTVGACGCAAICVITKLVDVHATLSIGVIAGDVPGDGGWGRLGLLLESDGSGDLGVPTNGCNCGRTWLARISSVNRYNLRKRVPVTVLGCVKRA